jgi:hypothetical protein
VPHSVVSGAWGHVELNATLERTSITWSKEYTSHSTICSAQVTVHNQTPHSTAFPLVLILSVLVQAIPEFPFNEKMPQCYSYSFVAVIAPSSASATGPTHPAEVYINEKPPRRLSFVLLLSRIAPYSPEQYHASPIPDHFLSQTFPNVTEYCRFHRDNAISQFDDDHNVGGRIWRVHTAQVRCEQLSLSSLALWLLLNPFYFVSPGLLSKLHVPSRKKPTTKGPVPRLILSLSEQPWETLWDCGVDNVNLPQSQSPVEDVSFPPGSFPNCHASGEQDCEMDQDVATPTNGTAWSSDEELTPLFSSNFPRIPHPNALRGEDHPDRELLGISAPSPIRPDASGSRN